MFILKFILEFILELILELDLELNLELNSKIYLNSLELFSSKSHFILKSKKY